MPYTAQEVLVASPSPCRMDDIDSCASTEEKKPSSAHSPQTVVVFDWDDTLLASSFLSGKGIKLDTVMDKNEELDNGLKELENSVRSVIELALGVGEVIIITNAETGWVELSAQKFIPGVVSLLSQVKILSARSTYEPMFPESPLKWKYYAFQEKLSGYLADARRSKNIISFGDSHVEREAVRTVTRGVANTLTKSVKFAERPSLEQLRRQIELVTNCFTYIHNHQGDLDLQLTVTLNNPTSPTSTSTSATTTTTTTTTPSPSVTAPAPTSPLASSKNSSSSSSTRNVNTKTKINTSSKERPFPFTSSSSARRIAASS